MGLRSGVMSIRVCIFGLGLLAASVAGATNRGGDDDGRSESSSTSSSEASALGVGVGIAGSDASSVVGVRTGDSSSRSDISGTVEAGDAHSEGGDATATAESGPVSLVVGGDEQRKTRTLYVPPSMVAGDSYPTVQCFRPKTGGVLSLPWGGAGITRGEIDPDCVKREYIRLAFAMGLLRRATRMWCMQPAVFEDFDPNPGDEIPATAEDCMIFEVEQATAEFETVAGDFLAEVTEEEFRELEAVQAQKLIEFDELEAKVRRQDREIRALKQQPDDSEQRQMLEALQQELKQDYERVSRKDG